MKNIIKIMYILPFILQSCVDGDTYNGSRTLVNDSGRDIVIISYKSDRNIKTYVFDKNISLKNQDKLSFSKKLFYGGNYINIAELVGDSIVIDYGDKAKKYGYLIKNDDRNPYFLDLGSSLNFTYTLTPEDYANANPK